MTASPDPAVVVRPASQQRLPDFFILGHAKSGTTALYTMLAQQPLIFMPSVKEPSFFVPELKMPRKRKNVRHPTTLEEYLALFDGALPQQRAGEATPSYLWSQTAAQRIAEVQPAARVIAILREPASFLRSLHLQFVQTGVETEGDLRTAIELEDVRREGRAMPRHSSRPKALLYSEHVRYVEQLRRYHAVFPAEQILVLIYEDFRADNEATVRRVLSFLEIDDVAPIQPIDVNPAVRMRSPRLYGGVRTLYMGRAPLARPFKAAIKALTPQRLRHHAIGAQRRAQITDPLPPDEKLMRELRVRFKGEVAALSEYLNRDLLEQWGYDDLG
jgi:hypothetical protein